MAAPGPSELGRADGDDQVEGKSSFASLASTLHNPPPNAHRDREPEAKDGLGAEPVGEREDLLSPRAPALLDEYTSNIEDEALATLGGGGPLNTDDNPDHLPPPPPAQRSASPPARLRPPPDYLSSAPSHTPSQPSRPSESPHEPENTFDAPADTNGPAPSDDHSEENSTLRGSSSSPAPAHSEFEKLRLRYQQQKARGGAGAGTGATPTGDDNTTATGGGFAETRDEHERGRSQSPADSDDTVSSSASRSKGGDRPRVGSQRPARRPDEEDKQLEPPQGGFPFSASKWKLRKLQEFAELGKKEPESKRDTLLRRQSSAGLTSSSSLSAQPQSQERLSPQPVHRTSPRRGAARDDEKKHSMRRSKTPSAPMLHARTKSAVDLNVKDTFIRLKTQHPALPDSQIREMVERLANKHTPHGPHGPPASSSSLQGESGEPEPPRPLTRATRSKSYADLPHIPPSPAHRMLNPRDIRGVPQPRGAVVIEDVPAASSAMSRSSRKSDHARDTERVLARAAAARSRTPKAPSSTLRHRRAPSAGSTLLSVARLGERGEVGEGDLSPHSVTADSTRGPAPAPQTPGQGPAPTAGPAGESEEVTQRLAALWASENEEDVSVDDFLALERQVQRELRKHKRELRFGTHKSLMEFKQLRPRVEETPGMPTAGGPTAGGPSLWEFEPGMDGGSAPLTLQWARPTPGAGGVSGAATPNAAALLEETEIDEDEKAVSALVLQERLRQAQEVRQRMQTELEKARANSNLQREIKALEIKLTLQEEHERLRQSQLEDLQAKQEKLARMRAKMNEQHQDELARRQEEKDRAIREAQAKKEWLEHKMAEERRAIAQISEVEIEQKRAKAEREKRLVTARKRAQSMEKMKSVQLKRATLEQEQAAKTEELKRTIREKADKVPSKTGTLRTDKDRPPSSSLSLASSGDGRQASSGNLDRPRSDEMRERLSPSPSPLHAHT